MPISSHHPIIMFLTISISTLFVETFSNLKEEESWIIIFHPYRSIGYPNIQGSTPSTPESHQGAHSQPKTIKGIKYQPNPIAY